MRATIYFLVEVKEAYNNYVEFENGVQFVANNSIDSVEHINRVGKVIDTPPGSIVSPGDLLLFHHNICRESYGLKGKKRKSVFNVIEDVYYIPSTEIFMYMRQGEDTWNAVDPYCFVEPIPVEDKVLPNGLVVEEEGYKGMKPLIGIMAYPNTSLISKGVKKGDIVHFSEYSEHEYMIHKKLYYKMQTNDILACKD